MLEPAWFLPIFTMLWFGITGLLAFASGWASLGKRYAASGSIAGTTSWFSSGAMGRRYFPVSYGNCLIVTTNPAGLHLSLWLPFRFLSPPLFIPWTEIQSVEKGWHWLFPCHVVTIREHWARITLYAWTGRRVHEAYESARARGAVPGPPVSR